MNSERLDQLLPEARRIAMEAGARVMEIYRAGFKVFEKANGSPVTTADLAAHQHIVERLEALDESLPVLSEESPDLPSWETRRNWDSYWLIDPLDGTRELIRKSEEFTVNIGLIHQRRPVLGVVGVPASGALYHARRGGGAWRAREEEKPVAIHSRPFPTDGSSVVAISFSHGRPEVQHLLSLLGPHQEKRVGSSLKSCHVAEGSLDLYPRYGSTSEWDTAAAQCVVEEAGGKVVDWRLRPLRYNLRPDMINPHFLVIGDPDHDWASLMDQLPRSDVEA